MRAMLTSLVLAMGCGAATEPVGKQETATDAGPTDAGQVVDAGQAGAGGPCAVRDDCTTYLCDAVTHMCDQAPANGYCATASDCKSELQCGGVVKGICCIVAGSAPATKGDPSTCCTGVLSPQSTCT